MKPSGCSGVATLLTENKDDEMTDTTTTNSRAVELVRQHFPSVQAVYLFGTYGTDDERPTSDVDMALLLPHDIAKETRSLSMHPLHSDLQQLFERELDLINLRQVNTVLKYEIITTARVLSIDDEYAQQEFEMLTMSFYQKLNEERAGILEEAEKTGRFYDV